MKVLFFIGGAYVSGLEIINLHLTNELSKNGIKIHCIVNGWHNGDIIERLEQNKIAFTEVKLGGVYLRKPSWTFDTLVCLPKARKKIKEIIRAWKPDVLHFCNYSNVLMLYDLVKWPSVYNLQEPHEPTVKHLIVYAILLKRINVFTTVSLATKKKLINLNIPEKKIAVIYNGIPVRKEEVKAAGKQVCFGVIGQIVPWKGHETLVKAVAELHERGIDNFKIRIYGNYETEYAQKVRQMIADLGLSLFFVWEGFEKEQDIIYDTVDCVVVPSLSQEPCSLTIIESMWRCKAVIASDRGGNTELIDDGLNGLLFQATNAEDLFIKLRELIQSPEKVTRLGREAYRKAFRHFQVQRMSEAYIEIYRNCLAD